MKNRIQKITFIFSVVLAMSLVSCQKLVDIKPENLVLAEDAIKNTADVQALLNSCYDEFANLMNGSVQNLHELRGENLAEPQNSAGSLYFTVYNRSTFSFRTADKEYLDFYNCILRVNTIFEHIDKASDMTPSEKSRIEGEGYFLRAWCHWELVKLWAQPFGFTPDNSHLGIPIRLKADKNVELRSTVAQVYEQIIDDLNTAENLIPENNGNYANKNAVKALKSKIYFTKHDYTNALKYSDELIKTNQYVFSDTFSRYEKGAPEEVIFELVSSLAFNRGSVFISNYRSDNNPNPAFKPAKSFYDLAKNTDDQRSAFYEIKNEGKLNEFIICHKFDRDWFNVPLLNITDMHLIRAEAIAELNGDKTTAISDVDKIRKRAFGANFSALSPTIGYNNLKDSARAQRRLEFAFEGDWTTQLQRRGAQGENIKIRTADWNCNGMILQFSASEKTAGFVFNPEGGCN
jgi:starch-binding outer membrane protein, SusD/RagB family